MASRHARMASRALQWLRWYARPLCHLRAQCMHTAGTPHAQRMHRAGSPHAHRVHTACTPHGHRYACVLQVRAAVARALDRSVSAADVSGCRVTAADFEQAISTHSPCDLRAISLRCMCDPRAICVHGCSRSLSTVHVHMHAVRCNTMPYRVSSRLLAAHVPYACHLRLSHAISGDLGRAHLVPRARAFGRRC